MEPQHPEPKLTLIATHVNADFDAVASLLAAQKLYPDSRVIFPGSQEKNIRNFFINSMGYLFNRLDFSDVDPSHVDRLVLVDTRQAGRIGEAATLLNKDDIQVHIYDHHPRMDSDIKGDVDVFRPTGATVTILTGLIKEKGIDISPDEATIMCLGIYEDTGSFTFASTTEEDFFAAAHLVARGADLNLVSDMIARDFNHEQIAILNEMIQAANRYIINGIEVMVTTVTSDTYVNDFAFLVHKMVKMENIDALFAVAQMGNKIYIVARSRILDVDVMEILAPFGGGGHAYAAAATLKNQTLAQTENRLLEILYKEIRPKRVARDLMSSPPITVDSHVSCRDAANLLTRYNINALIVMKPENGRSRPVGYISRQVIEKALFHKLERIPVQEYMHSELVFVAPSSSLSEIQEKIIENQQRILPVIDGGTLIGVITRTDLLNILVRQFQRNKSGNIKDPHRESIHARTRNVVKFMQERLPERILQTLKSIGEVAAQRKMNAYVVGGFVRDLFLYRKNEDLDVVIEGDGIAFARAFAGIHGARVHSHEKFGTAVIIFQDGFKIDVASARMEYYQFPAALPTVEMSSIKLDLFRRDFTINTLAIHLSPTRFGTLIDFFYAQRDLKDKVIRVLHNLSFVEDPTRVFRAIRFEQRFGFSIGKLTAGLIDNAVKMDFFTQLSGRRVFSELKLILQEENPIPALTRLGDYDLFKFLHASIKPDDGLIEKLNAAKKVLSWFDLLFLDESYMKWAVYFLVLIRECSRTETKELCERLELGPRNRALLQRDRFEAEACLSWLAKQSTIENAAIYARLSAFKTELALYIMAMAEKESIKRSISLYFTHLRFVTPIIGGRDLMRLGYTPGPIFKEVLTGILNEKLNGGLKTREAELKFAADFRNRLLADPPPSDAEPRRAGGPESKDVRRRR